MILHFKMQYRGARRRRDLAKLGDRIEFSHFRLHALITTGYIVSVLSI